MIVGIVQAFGKGFRKDVRDARIGKNLSRLRFPFLHSPDCGEMHAWKLLADHL